MQADSMIPVIRITNPFNPREFVHEELVWVGTKTLADYFPVGVVTSVVSINGKIIDAADFGITYLEQGDNLVVCPVPQGGGDEKGVLGMVAMIAVAVFAPYVAGFIAPGIMAGGGIGAAMLTAGVTLAGSMLVQSIFAPSKKTETTNNSSTYGIDGAKNTSVEGLPVPVNYGKFRMAGNIINLHIENEGDTQTLYVLINAGEGPIASITDVKMNGNPISDYKAAEMQVRLGTSDQSVIPWFSDTIVPQSRNEKLTTDWSNYTTAASVDKLRIDFAAPNGLFKVNKGTGALDEVEVNLDIQYRKVGDMPWLTMSLQNIVTGSRPVEVLYDITAGSYDQDGNFWRINPETGAQERYTPTNSWIYTDTGGAVTGVDLEYIQANYDISSQGPSVPSYSNVALMKAGSRATVRRSFDSGRLPTGHYQVRVRRTTAHSTEDTVSDEVYLTDINEILLDPMAMPHTALLGIKIKLGEQLSGLPQITFLNGGRTISVWGKPFVGAQTEQWFNVADSNPAWIVWDILTNRRYGGGMNSSRLDFYAFKRWAAYCDAQGLTFNGPIDTEMNVWDACQYVLRAGHAQIVNVGTRYTVVVERAQTPVMMFSVANMVENSYRETWLPVSDRANEVDVTFFDKEDEYKQRTIKIYDPAALTAGNKQRTSAVTLFGVTEYERAYKEGMFMMNLNRFILKTISFSAPLEAIACTVGDLIYVQHDMPNWAQAGRFESGCTSSILKLDRQVTMENGKSYKVLAHHDKKQRATGTITNIAGDTVFLSGFATSQPVRRLQVGDLDLTVLETYTGSVAVESTAGLSIGQTYVAYDTDVIEEIGVVMSPGTTDTVQLVSPMSVAPVQFGQWMFGEVERVKAPFRIKMITGSSDLNREIKAIQYDERVYDYTRFAAAHVPISNPTETVLSQVRGLEVYEETRISGQQIISTVTAAWQQPYTGQYAGADVYVSRDLSAYALMGQVDHRNSTSISATRGETLKVKVVAFDIFGKRVPYGSAPEATHKVVGETSSIDVGGVTGADVIWSGRDCRLRWRYNSTTHSYEFGSEPVGAGADAGALDPQFKDYEIRVYDMAGKLRRTEHTTDNSYTYSFEKNSTDGLTRRLRFQICMRDVFNNVGDPATLTTYNPPPTLTGFTVDATFESADLKHTHSNDTDYAGTLVWMSEEEADVTGVITAPGFNDHLVYDGPDSLIHIPSLMFNQDYYVRVACYDVFGKTDLTPSDVLHFKTTFLNVDAIAEGVLGGSLLLPELQDRINLIDGPSSLANSVAARLTAEALARTTAISAEASSRTTAILAEANARASAVAAEVSARTAAITTEANARSAAITAEATARAAALAQEATDRGAAITTEQVARQAADASISATVTTLTASTAANAAAISTEQASRTTADTALASSISTLTASVGTQISAAIATEQSVRASADTAIASNVTALTSVVSGNTAAITAEQTTRASADTALASTITALTASVATDINAAITTEQAVRASADTALATSVSVVSANTSANAAAILAEQSARTTADTALSTSITAVQASTASNAAAIVTEQTARTAGDSSLATSIATVQASTATNAAAITTEATARANADTALSSSIATVQASAAANAAAIVTEQTARTNADGALATSISTVQATGTSNTAAIATEQSARIAADTALASSISLIETSVGNNASAIVAESTARTTADTAITNSLTSVQATTAANTAAITAEQNARTTADTALAVSVTAVQTSVDANTAAIASESSARSTADTAFATTMTSVQASTAANAAAIATESTTRATAVSALSTTISGLTTTVNGNTSAITSESTTRANETSALSYSLSQLTSTVGGHTTTIGTTVSTVNGLSGQYTVKIDNNGYVAGFGLASYSTTTGITSEFIIRADKFAVVMPSYAGVYPFTIGNVNGVPRVIISNALIGDASIATAHIGNLVVQTHNINTGACTDAFTASSAGTDAVLWFTVPANCSSFVVTAQTGYAFGSTGSGENYVELIDPAPCNIYVNGSPASVIGAGGGSAVVIGPTAGSTQVVVNRTVTSPYNGTYGGSINFVVMLYKR